MKRSLSNLRSRIWKGFKFHRESPSVNWEEHTGGSKLGASIGVIIKNSLDIQISEFRFLTGLLIYKMQNDHQFLWIIWCPAHCVITTELNVNKGAFFVAETTCRINCLTLVDILKL